MNGFTVSLKSKLEYSVESDEDAEVYCWQEKYSNYLCFTRIYYYLKRKNFLKIILKILLTKNNN